MSLFFTNGTADYVECGSVAGISTNSIHTIAIWARMDSAARMGLMEKAVWLTGNSGWYLIADMLASTARIEYVHKWTAGGQWVSATNSLVTGTWTHLAVTYTGVSSGNNPIMYINGSSQTVTRQTSSTGVWRKDSRAMFTYARASNPGGGFDELEGYLQHGHYYNRVLSQVEIQQIMKQPASIKQGLLIYTRFVSATTCGDYSGNGNHGTVKGATVNAAISPPIVADGPFPG